MRLFYVLRGLPGAGKSTFLKKNNLMQYAVSPDSFRELLSAPIAQLRPDGSVIHTINPKNDAKAWKLTLETLHDHFRQGQTTILDATNIVTSNYRGYMKLAAKYNYRVYVVNFDVPYGVALSQNNNRPEYKWVPESVMKKFHSYLNSEISYVPKKFNLITPQKMLETLNWRWENLDSEYDSVQIIGDVHSCATALKEVLGTYDKNRFYVFLGDYFDRGIEPQETYELLTKWMSYKNTAFLVGNHENYLRHYAAGDKLVGDDFINSTLPELEKIGFNPKEAVKFLKHTQPLFAMKFKGRKYVCSHAGLIHIDQNNFTNKLCLENEEYFTKNLGDYEIDIDKVYSLKASNPDKDIIQIHGHRNSFEHGVLDFQTIFNLEQGVEAGNKLGSIIIK